MKKTVLSFLTILSLGLNAQITITDDDFPSGGDTAQVSISTDFELDYTSTGPDYLWDYSALTFTSQRIDTFFDIDDASITYQLVFNNGWFDPDYQADYYTPYLNFVIPSSDLIDLPISNPVNFTKIESDKVEIVGVGMEIGGIEVPVKNEIIDVQYELPMNFEDEWVSNSFFEIDLNPAYDGILRRHQERTTVVDGWGQVITPHGTFGALRTMSTIDFTDSLRITIGETEMWIEMPTPTQIIYSWWANDQKIPVLEVVMQDFFGTESVTSVEYKDRDWSDLSVSESNLESNYIVYPNPSNALVSAVGPAKVDRIEVYDMSGKLVTFGNQTIDVSSLESGVYVLEIIVGETIIPKRLIVE